MKPKRKQPLFGRMRTIESNETVNLNVQVPFHDLPVSQRKMTTETPYFNPKAMIDYDLGKESTFGRQKSVKKI